MTVKPRGIDARVQTYLHGLTRPSHLRGSVPDVCAQFLDDLPCRHAEPAVPFVDRVGVRVAESCSCCLLDLAHPAPRHEQELPMGDVCFVQRAAPMGSDRGAAILR